MANQEHLDRLRQSVQEWNQWRKNNLLLRIDLSGANLTGANLHSANLSGANLHSAVLVRAFLVDANLSGADLSKANLSRASLRGVNFSGAFLCRSKLDNANLTGADLTEADLGEATLSNANLSNANLSESNIDFACLSESDLSESDLSESSFYGVDFSGANLSFSNLSESNLNCANLTNVNLSESNLYGANLNNADLSIAQALGTNFSAAKLTGACIEDWHINSQTNLQDVICEHIFIKYDDKHHYFTDRRPHDPNQIFAPGEFTKRYQIFLESVELFFGNGIDWRAFLSSLEDLKAQYGDELNIQGIERKTGGSLVVRLEVPSDADKGAVERAIKESYEAKLQVVEAQYRAQLQELKIQHSDEIITLYRQHNAEMREITKCLADKPIIVEAKAVADNHSSSETYNTTVHGNVGNLANKMQDQASQQANQYTGVNLNEIAALIQSLRGIAETFPQAQRTEAIEHLEDLETDLKQLPEKRKQSRMKAALVALIATATAVSGAVAGANEFATQVQELSDKLGIPLPIEQVEPQQKNAIDVKASGSSD